MVEAIAADATRRGQVVGIRLAEPADDGHATPWKRPPSEKHRHTRIPGPLSNEVRAVLAQRLFVDKEGLPSPLPRVPCSPLESTPWRHSGDGGQAHRLQSLAVQSLLSRTVLPECPFSLRFRRRPSRLGWP
jgi:hypothetical protein